MDSRRSLILDAFKSLSENDRGLLESAASIGFKFDADLLAQIWNLDMINVIASLEKHEGTFVRDQSNEDNIFSFVDKLTHDVILQNALNVRGNDETRQLIIEYQKRIIKSIVENKDRKYLESLDVDILLSATERCFNYSNVEYIRKHTQLIGFEACLKLAKIGKDKKTIELLQRLVRFNLELSLSDMVKISQTLLELTQVNRDVLRIDFKLENDQLFLDYFHVKCRQNANNFPQDENFYENPFVLTSVVLMGGVVDYLKGLRKETGRFVLISDLEVDVTIRKRYKLIDELSTSHAFTETWATTRILFYKAIMGEDQLQELPLILKSALSNKYYDLAGEIARHYCLQDISINQRKELLLLSIRLFKPSSESGPSMEGDSGDEITAEVLMRGISDVLKSQTLSAKQAKDFNVLISRVRELMHELREVEYVLQLCDLSLNISTKYQDHQGIVLGLSYQGNALFKKKMYEESTLIYLKYFEYLIRTSRDINDFLYPLEGLLMNSKMTNDMSVYRRCKDELYEHLMYLGSSAISRKLEKSLYDPEKTLSSLFKDIKTLDFIEENFHDENENDLVLINSVLNILVGISYADGDLDETEMYDLRESCIALSRSLNINQAAVLKYIDQASEKFAGLDLEARANLFREACETLCSSQERSFTLTVLTLCIDMSKADGVVTDTERELIGIAREIFERHA